MPEELSQQAKEAVHKTKNAQQAVEVAREAQLKEFTVETARQTKEALFEGLREVFKGTDHGDAEKMTVIHEKLPILCTRVNKIDSNIENMQVILAELKDAQKWATRLLLGGIVTVVVAVIINLILK